MEWTEIKIRTAVKALEEVTAIVSMVAGGGLYIEDYSDLETQAVKIANIDLIDEELVAQQREDSIVHIYLAPDESPAEIIAYVGTQLTAAGIGFAIETDSVREEDWATAWKKYYHPIALTEGLAICPSWEEYTPKEGQKVIRLDPGMAFGTGTHDTTQLCLKLLEKHLTAGEALLDIGCGSGILAIGGKLLGSAHTVAVDIDPHAVKVAGENAALNGIKDIELVCTDLVASVGGRFDVICANIVADVIIRLAPSLQELMAEGARFIASGIILERKDEVIAALEEQGLMVFEALENKGWAALACKRK